MARGLRDSPIKLLTLTSFAPLLTEAENCQLVKMLGRGKTQPCKDELEVRALEQLIPYLSDADLHNALEVLEAFETPDWHLRGILALTARCVHRDQVDQALALMSKARDEREEARLIEALAPILRETHFHHALRLAREIREPENRARAFTALALNIPESFLNEVIAAAESIQDELERVSLGLALV